jgi:MATE family multidrug resistance protein
MQMFTLFSYFMDGFAFAGEALCGKYYGAKDFVGLRRCVANLMLLGLIVAAVFTLLYAFGIEGIIALLTDDKAIQMVAQRFNYWAVAVPLAGFLAFTADGVAIGLTHTRLMLKSMVASMIVFFIVCYTCSPGMGNHALWLAFVIYLLSRGVILTAMLRGPIKG